MMRTLTVCVSGTSGDAVSAVGAGTVIVAGTGPTGTVPVVHAARTNAIDNANRPIAMMRIRFTLFPFTRWVIPGGQVPDLKTHAITSAPPWSKAHNRPT